MQKKWAIRWLLPAVIILLLHTLVSHSHSWTNNENKGVQTTCEHHHHHHGVWDFFEHLLTHDCSVEHLENYPIVNLDFNKKNFPSNTIFFINNSSPFYPFLMDKTIQKIIPQNDFIFPKNRFFTEISFRGPPTLK
jgi:hypothetical protein